MTTVIMEIGRRPIEAAETQVIEFVPDLDVLSESDKCSCSAGDDNPF